jgi:hypothetical protein
MTVRHFWMPFNLSVSVCLALVISILKSMACPSYVYPQPPTPASDGDDHLSIAVQKARLKLDDGRTATFRFTTAEGKLHCSAAVGLDQVLSYELVPETEPAPPEPPPVPQPNPPLPPSPAPGNLRVLFLYDPAKRGDMSPNQQAILTSPELRGYLDRHCPMEGGCADGACRLTAIKTPSYRFLPSSANVSGLSPVWRQTFRAAAGKVPPWLLATNEAGQTVIDRPWPANVTDTMKLLREFGGP